MSAAIDDLHQEAFWVCVAITVAVFGAMIYSLLKYRTSHAAVRSGRMHGSRAELVWTAIPALILVAAAIPAAELILKAQDLRKAELSVRVIGHQWKWQYQYLDAGEGIGFFSTLEQDPKSGPLGVDHPLVVPSGTKVRLLLSSADGIIHTWYVPELGLKRSAIPGLVNELWFKVDSGKEGIYHGECATLCGRDHAFMPVVVDVRTPAQFEKWLDGQKAALKPAAAEPAAAVRTGQVTN